ncbi:MAG: hypothetical protein K2H52_08045 [Lachnospiraceae bacterium]|nr:hypothetical protein [Lachnospiraceae bacterium]
MARWWKGILKDIREKTAHMDSGQKLQYIAAYYWYHILFAVLLVFLIILLIRHFFFGEPPKVFNCVMINQAIDFERDGMLAEDFAADMGISAEQISIDSNYVFSYVGKELEGVNESSYDKFFFRLGGGELDAAIVPESFYRYCVDLEYGFADLGDMLSEEEKIRWQGNLVETNGVYNGIYVKDLPLMEYLNQEKDDPVLLVFFQNAENAEVNRSFLEFAIY